MADENTGKSAPVLKLVPIEWPDGGAAIYANHLLLQREGDSVYLTFCQVNPPVIFGSPEEQKHQLEQIKSAKAISIAKLMVPLAAFRDMLRVMQENIGRPDSSSENVRSTST